MAGVIAFGYHLPRYRLPGALVAQAWGGSAGGDGRGERAVANYDEDVITMAVAAALDAAGAGGMSGEGAALFLASTTAPYTERSNAVTVAGVLGMAETARLADFGGALRCGVTALRGALDAVRADAGPAAGGGGAAPRALVAAADQRQARPGDPLERQFGDAGAAVMVGGGDEVIAEVEGALSTQDDFLDAWQLRSQPFVQSGDPAFVRSRGAVPHMAAACRSLLARCGRAPADVKHLCFTASDRGVVAEFPKALGGGAPAVDLTASIGFCGAADPLLQLCVALEKAAPGDRILLVGHGSGADALLLRATDRIREAQARRGVAGGGKEFAARAARKKAIASYARFLQFRDLVPTEKVRPFSSLPTMYRERERHARLLGAKCLQCGAVNFPPQRVCWKCHARDRFEAVALGMRGTVVTFTCDTLAYTLDPPVIMVSADVEGGGRFYTQLTDADPDQAAVGMVVERVFRKFHEGEGFNHYFWKFRPASA
ncbi:MAG: OB-fold domain-containing protein [Planctomycetes bacterium]|nr:OB-fold domain-containing protein [Planctomycetota bacterium]